MDIRLSSVCASSTSIDITTMARMIVLTALVAVVVFVTFAAAKPSKKLKEPRGGEIPLSAHEKRKQPGFTPHPRHRAPASIPPTFDAREKWSQCNSIKDIRDQGQCGTCWAVSAASVLSDRICISELAAGKTPSQTYVSSLELATCKDLSRSGDTNCNAGGNTANAYKWATIKGYITGGNFNSKLGCQPYPVSDDPIPLTCSKTCTNTAYKKTPATDTAFAIYTDENPSQTKINENVIKMQQDILASGPITVSMKVWSDFSSWTPDKGAYRGPGPSAVRKEGHAIRIIGWGIDKNSVKYWKIANSWGPERGDKGVYWIEMGRNVVGIEESPTAPIVVMPNTCGSLCDSPITQVVRMDAKNLASPIYAFQGNCTTQVTVSAQGKLTPVGSPQPISKVFVGGPAGPITSWMGGNGPADALWIINPAGQAGACSAVAGSTKLDCNGGTATAGASAQTIVGSDKYVFYNDQNEYLFSFKGGSTRGSGEPIGDKIKSKFSTVNSLLNIDGTNILVCGLDSAGKTSCGTMKLSDKSVSAPQPIKNIATKC